MNRIKLEIEFIPCTEAMPEESGEYLCVNSNNNHIENYCYSARYKSFNVRDSFDSFDARVFSVTHSIKAWAKLPDLTKASDVIKLEEALAGCRQLEEDHRKSLEQQRRRLHRRRRLQEKTARKNNRLRS